MDMKNQCQCESKTRSVINCIFWSIELLFAFRVLFKVLDANSNSTFVNVVYAVTDILLAPFRVFLRVLGIRLHSDTVV